MTIITPTEIVTIEPSRTELVTVAGTKITLEDARLAFSQDKSFEGFDGGFEVLVADLDKIVPPELHGKVDEEGEPTTQTIKDILPNHTNCYLGEGLISNDGTKVLIRACRFYNFRQFYPLNPECLLNLVKVLGVENIYTKSAFRDKLMSAEYITQTETL